MRKSIPIKPKQLAACAMIAFAPVLQAADTVGWCGKGGDNLWSNTANWYLHSDKSTNPSAIDFARVRVDQGYGLSGDALILLGSSQTISSAFENYYNGGSVTLAADSTNTVLTAEDFASGNYVTNIFNSVGMKCNGALKMPGDWTSGSATLIATNANLYFSGESKIATKYSYGSQGDGCLSVVGDSSVVFNNKLTIGDNSTVNATGTVTVAGNSYFKVGNDMTVGETSSGIFNMNGGVCDLDYVYLGHQSGAKGIFNLNGGTVIATQFANWQRNGTGIININGGVLAPKNGGVALIETGYTINVSGNFAVSNDVACTIKSDIDTKRFAMVKRGSGTLTLSGLGNGTILVEDGSVVTNGAAGGYTIIEGSFTIASVANGETYVINGATSLPNTILYLEAGATILMPSTGGLSFDNDYEIRAFVLPDDGKVTIRLVNAPAQASGTYTLVEDSFDVDLEKITLDQTGLSLNARLFAEDGKLKCRLAEKGKVISIDGTDVELDDDADFNSWLTANGVPSEKNGLLAPNANGLSPLSAYLLGYDTYDSSTASPAVTNDLQYLTVGLDYDLGGKNRRKLENATLAYSVVGTNNLAAAVGSWETVAPPRINPGVALYADNAARYNKLVADVVGSNVPEFDYSHASSSVYQWSVVSTPPESERATGRAFLWIPETCQALRGVVVGQRNMLEEPIFECPAFRKELEKADLGIVFITPIQGGALSVDENVTEWITGLLNDLATESGYSELATCPVAFIGHSAMAMWPYMQCAALKDRAFAGVSLKGSWADTSSEYGFASDTVGEALSGIPFLLVDGEYEDAENRANWTRTFCNKFPSIPFSFLGEDGAGHFDWSDELAHYLGVYFRKAIDFKERGGTTTSEGWLMERWKRYEAPSCRPAPKNEYTGVANEAYWYFDEEMIRETEYLQERFRQQAKTPLVNYRYKGAELEQHNTHTQIQIPFDGRTTFSFQPMFSDTVGSATGRLANWTGLSAGDPAPHPSSAATIYVQKICGGCAKIGKDQYALRFNRAWPMPTGSASTDVDFQMIFPGDSTYQRVVQQARMTVGQSSYDAGFTGYYVREGAATIDPVTGALTKLPLPPRAAANHKITYIKWVWGGTSDEVVVEWTNND